jgi:hypothetical protein
MSTPTPLKRVVIKEKLFRCPQCDKAAAKQSNDCFLETFSLIEERKTLLIASVFRVPAKFWTDNKTTLADTERIHLNLTPRTDS